MASISTRELVQHLHYIIIRKNSMNLNSTCDKIKKIFTSISENEFVLTSPPPTSNIQRALLAATRICSVVTGAVVLNQRLTENEDQQSRDSLIVLSALTSIVAAIGSLCLEKSINNAQEIDSLCRWIFTNLQNAIQEQSNIPTILSQVTSKKRELDRLGLYPQESLALSSIDPDEFANEFIPGVNQLSLSLYPFSKKIDDVLTLLNRAEGALITVAQRQCAVTAYKQLKTIASTVKANLSPLAQQELTRRLERLENLQPTLESLVPIRIQQVINGNRVIIYKID